MKKTTYHRLNLSDGEFIHLKALVENFLRNREDCPHTPLTDFAFELQGVLETYWEKLYGK